MHLGETDPGKSWTPRHILSYLNTLKVCLSSEMQSEFAQPVESIFGQASRGIPRYLRRLIMNDTQERKA